ncbi:MAG: hypothetical protein JST80_13290 [Bdellovibrionales bacterium]|nr:hypothetical protein [Bdellovibrionales bacterium]
MNKVHYIGFQPDLGVQTEMEDTISFLGDVAPSGAAVSGQIEFNENRYFCSFDVSLPRTTIFKPPSL